MADQVQQKTYNPNGNKGKWDEIGSIGLDAFSGFVTEAYARELFWPGVESLYSKMWRSDPEVTLARNVFESLAAKLRVEFIQPAEIENPTDDDHAALEFANQVLDDIEGGISQWLVSCMTRLPFFGWGWWEVVPGLRQEKWRPPANDPWRSEYDDGLIGFRRFAFRQYSSFFGWDMDDSTGRVNGFIQNDPPNPMVTIPTRSSLHLRFGDTTNPEGLATLESIWRLERIKYGLEVINMIGLEHSAGFAKFTAEKELTSDDKTYIKKVARSLLAAKEGNYLALPQHISAEIMDTPFSAATSILDAVRYYGILKLAMFHMQWAALGVLSPYGSYSTIKDANQFFLTLFNSMVTGVSTQVDEQIGKRLFEYPVNKERFPNMTKRPVLSISKAEKIIDLDELGSFMTAANTVLPMGDDDMIALRRKSEILPEALPDEPVNIQDEPEPEETEPEESLDSDGMPVDDSDTDDGGVSPDESEDESDLAQRKFRVDDDELPLYPQVNEAYPTDAEIRSAVRSFNQWAKKNRPGWAKILNATELDNDEDDQLSDPIRMGDSWPLQVGEVIDLNGAWIKGVKRWRRDWGTGKHPVRDPAIVALYLSDDFPREILRRTKYKIGYEIRTEKVFVGEDEQPVVIQSAAYNDDGDYIGDPRMARYLIKERGIMPELAAPDKNVCSVGYCETDQRWYGWSHRAICGFAIGDRIFDPEYGNDMTPFKEHGKQTIRSKVQQRKAAVAFAEYVS